MNGEKRNNKCHIPLRELFHRENIKRKRYYLTALVIRTHTFLEYSMVVGNCWYGAERIGKDLKSKGACIGRLKT